MLRVHTHTHLVLTYMLHVHKHTPRAHIYAARTHALSWTETFHRESLVRAFFQHSRIFNVTFFFRFSCHSADGIDFKVHQTTALFHIYWVYGLEWLSHVLSTSTWYMKNWKTYINHVFVG